MTARPAPPLGRPSSPSERPSELRPLPRSGQPGRVLGGLLLVIVCGAVTAFLFAAAANRQQVLVVARDVPIGAKLTADDLAAAQVGADAPVKTMPASQKGQMVGLYAATDLRAGTLLTASEVTGALSPSPGQQVVAVAFKASQLPPLHPGDQVLVVPTPGAGGQDTGGNAGSAAAPLANQVPAVVDQVADPDADGMVRVSLLAASDVGSAIVRQASTGRISLVVTMRRGNS